MFILIIDFSQNMLDGPPSNFIQLFKNLGWNSMNISHLKISPPRRLKGLISDSIVNRLTILLNYFGLVFNPITVLFMLNFEIPLKCEKSF